jgi:hypothetical protein
MSIQDLRNAFIAAAAGRARFDVVTLVHVPTQGNAQVIEASGALADGTPFTWTSDPIDARVSPIEAAREMVKARLGGQS